MTVDLGDFAAALRHELEEEMREAPPVRDLADVFARARAIDAAVIPAGLTPDLSAIEDGDDEERIDPGLQLFAAALRREVETSAGDRQLAPIVARPRWAGRVAAVFALAAAAVLAFVGLSQLGPESLEREHAGTPVVESNARETSDASLPYVPGEAPSQESSHTAAHLEAQPEAEIEPPVQPTEPEPATIDPARERPAKHHGPTLDDLDEQARARWEAGDLIGAEALLRKLIARTGKSPRAELAYGDLFALARQRGGSKAQAEVWREYLRRFPRGRYADDAQGGLCRLTDEPERASCWRDYLAAHRGGAHAKEARRHVEGETG